jgi:AcrR family transcriptional regulator
MESAQTFFLEKGFDNSSVPEIVKQASVAQGTFYRYFKNKQDCFNQLVENLIGAFLENFKLSAQNTSRDAIISGPKRAIEMIRKNKELIRLMILESRHIDQRLMENLRKQRALTEKNTIEQLIERGDSERFADIKSRLIANLVDSIFINEVLEGIKVPQTSISSNQLLESIIYELKE